jgi:hypothetical protein
VVVGAGFAGLAAGSAGYDTQSPQAMSANLF